MRADSGPAAGLWPDSRRGSTHLPPPPARTDPSQRLPLPLTTSSGEIAKETHGPVPAGSEIISPAAARTRSCECEFLTCGRGWWRRTQSVCDWMSREGGARPPPVHAGDPHPHTYPHGESSLLPPGSLIFLKTTLPFCLTRTHVSDGPDKTPTPALSTNPPVTLPASSQTRPVQTLPVRSAPALRPGGLCRYCSLRLACSSPPSWLAPGPSLTFPGRVRRHIPQTPGQRRAGHSHSVPAPSMFHPGL